MPPVHSTHAAEHPTHASEKFHVKDGGQDHVKAPDMSAHVIAQQGGNDVHNKVNNPEAMRRDMAQLSEQHGFPKSEHVLKPEPVVAKAEEVKPQSDTHEVHVKSTVGKDTYVSNEVAGTTPGSGSSSPRDVAEPNRVGSTVASLPLEAPAARMAVAQNTQAPEMYPARHDISMS